MPAAVVKGIIISISIITALGIAVLESPHIQAWLEEQRRKLVELLRNIGEELDPESRRMAEAFAFEGRTPANDESTRRETRGSIDAVAVATGRSLSGPSQIRHIPVRGPSIPDEAERRQRQGEEYLARRNQQMIELRERNRAARDESQSTPSTPTFDELVDNDGRLKHLEPRPIESTKTTTDAGMQTIENTTREDAGFALGSQLANPFDDEYALDRSVTPRPPVPPKPQEYQNISNHAAETDSSPTLRSESEQPILSEADTANLSFEEQLALALSLSEAEDHSRRPRLEQAFADNDDPDIQAAIAASLKEIEVASQPLVDVSVPTRNSQLPLQQRIREWESSLSSPVSNENTVGAPSVVSEGTDDLYHASPQLAYRNLHDWQSLQPSAATRTSDALVGDKLTAGTAASQPSTQNSFHSVMPLAATAGSYDANLAQLVVDSNNTRPESPAATTATMDFETETESFASMSRPMSVAESRTAFSGAEMVTDAEETDHDVMSEDGDGILTPDSWSEVESRDGEASEAGQDEDHRMVGA